MNQVRSPARSPNNSSGTTLPLSPQPGGFEEFLGDRETLDNVAPVLILDRAEEEQIKPELPRQMAAPIAEAALAIEPGAGHSAPTAQPKAFNRIVPGRLTR